MGRAKYIKRISVPNPKIPPYNMHECQDNCRKKDIIASESPSSVVEHDSRHFEWFSHFSLLSQSTRLSSKMWWIFGEGRFLPSPDLKTIKEADSSWVCFFKVSSDLCFLKVDSDFCFFKVDSDFCTLKVGSGSARWFPEVALQGFLSLSI